MFNWKAARLFDAARRRARSLVFTRAGRPPTRSLQLCAAQARCGTGPPARESAAGATAVVRRPGQSNTPSRDRHGTVAAESSARRACACVTGAPALAVAPPGQPPRKLLAALPQYRRLTGRRLDGARKTGARPGGSAPWWLWLPWPGQARRAHPDGASRRGDRARPSTADPDRRASEVLALLAIASPRPLLPAGGPYASGASPTGGSANRGSRGRGGVCARRRGPAVPGVDRLERNPMPVLVTRMVAARARPGESAQPSTLTCPPAAASRRRGGPWWPTSLRPLPSGRCRLPSSHGHRLAVPLRGCRDHLPRMERGGRRTPFAQDGPSVAYVKTLTGSAPPAR